MIKNGRGGLLLIKSVQRLGLFGSIKEDILKANLWEVFEALDFEVVEEDYRENLKVNIQNKKK